MKRIEAEIREWLAANFKSANADHNVNARLAGAGEVRFKEAASRYAAEMETLMYVAKFLGLRDAETPLKPEPSGVTMEMFPVRLAAMGDDGKLHINPLTYERHGIKTPDDEVRS